MSIQGHDVSQLDYLKKTYLPKPMIWDEVEYEGNVPYGWGDLTPEVMSQRFWTGITNGVYVGKKNEENIYIHPLKTQIRTWRDIPPQHFCWRDFMVEQRKRFTWIFSPSH